ncbi:hypothetical protein [Arthrobacter zhaoxinii]|uniref:hypothetical protein n=1 Tax=Arthrobacter zhaoxinii TaxID=2964616 RepID=UPI002101F4F6|nr:hypothetical protein [Arthrobacter zhaoxinii]MCQ2001323.1 hypothetical protein [Arthrobacter zhaoxinii]
MSEHVPPGTSYINPYNGRSGAGPVPAAVGGTPIRPKQVDSSFGLLLGALSLTALGILTRITLLNAGDGVTGEGAVWLVTLGIGFAVTSVAAGFIRKGHHWARILLTAYTAVSVLTFLTGTNLLSWGAILTMVAATVLLYWAPSRAYFKAMDQHRRNTTN